MLEDGQSFKGETLGSGAEACGELIFNTAVVGYQEMLTDPANAGKILVLTYPLIGNYGCAEKFNESKKVWCAGLVIKEQTRISSNWQAQKSFDSFVKEQNLSVITGVDTRTLAVHLRQKGEMAGIISKNNSGPKELTAKIESWRKNRGASLLPEISVSKPHTAAAKKGAKRVAVLDLGLTKSILRQLEILGLSVSILPYNSRPKEILSLKAQGLIISGGPEEDSGLEEVIANVKNILGRLPLLGIATGCQVIARALGAKTEKMKLGHHGVNYPVYNPASYKGEITVQNHSHVINTDSLNKIKAVKITAYNLNDRSIEEIESRKLKILGLQYNPVSPGFSEVNGAFKKFAKMF